MRVTYTTKDGVTFNTALKAKKHEKLAESIDRVRKIILPKKFDNCNFANGHGYIQLSREQVDSFEREAMFLIEKKSEGRGLYDGWLGRLLCDNESPLYSLWLLAQCVDKSTLRLWGQMYYASHPYEGDDIQLNKEIK